MIINILDRIKMLKAFTLALWEDTKGQASAGFITVIVFIFIWLACLPIVVAQVQELYTGAWNFTGYSGSATLLGLVPFLYVIAGVIVIVSFALKGKGTE